MIKHLKVPDSEAQESKEFLESIDALNSDFLPIKKEGFVLWPLNFTVEGEIVECQGLVTNRSSRDYRNRLSPEIRKLAP
ncbi:MAG TPA: hypothetical protein EYO72_06905, partial [Marine Group III euryarchaeote]|nr:hypothetical protein [Marine Group III euryarchaeote]